MLRIAGKVAWSVVLAAFAMSAVGLLAGYVLDQPWVAVLAVAAGITVGAGSWQSDAELNEFTFTQDGATVLGWIFAFFLPPAGLFIGIWLRRRRSRHGTPMIFISAGWLAVYAGAFAAELL